VNVVNKLICATLFSINSILVYKMSSIVALIMSAGRGSRFIAKHDMPKQYLLLGGIPVLRSDERRVGKE